MKEGGAASVRMSGSGRKRSSKWDLKEGSRMSFEDVEDNTWPGKAGISFRDKESRRDWLPPEAAGGTRSKWSAMEPLPGRRSSRRDDNIDEDRSRTLKATYEDESYGTRMSPGLDEWRQKSFRNSPKNEYKRTRRSQSRSRSRSRSPVHGFGRESGAHERTRSISGVSAQLCKDFVAGRCRRGSHCPFLHQDTETCEDDWERRPRKAAASKYPISHDSKQYPMGSGRSADCCNEFLKGSCRRGESCRYAHHGASDPSSRGSANDGIRERDNDRRHRYASPERRAERETRRAADIPCKFFAAGNCRNGKYCRFSHNDQTPSPDKRSRDGRWPPSQNSDDVEKSWNDPKWSESHTSDAAKLSENKNEKLDAPELRLSVRCMEDGWGHNLVENKTHNNPPTNEVVEIDKKEALPLKTENAGDNSNVSEQRAPENWLGDMEMSPDWNYRLQPSNHINKGEHASLSSCELQDGSGRARDTPAIMPPISNETSSIQQGYNLKEIGGSALPHDDGVTGKTAGSYINISTNALATQSFNKNGLSSIASPIPNLNAGQIQEAILTNPPRGGTMTAPQNQTLVQDRKMINIPDIGNVNAPLVNLGIPMAQNMASNEHLTQLTSLSVSLAQFLANGQQLPQLYAARNSHNGTFANSEGTAKPDSMVTIQPNQAVEPRKQYDPICDSVEPGKHHVNTNPPDQKLELLSKNLSPSSLSAGLIGGDFNKFHSEQEFIDKSSQLNQPGPGVSSEVNKENNGVGSEESNKVQEQDKGAQENGPLENSDGDGKADESKKNKDAKGNRAFKFALVEFVKDLLKPAWKEGQMSKDAYKNIVKKVVDKVTGTMQSASIPTTQEKIEQYLSVSKPKLTKLVQAYVEKFQKDK